MALLGMSLHTVNTESKEHYAVDNVYMITFWKSPTLFIPYMTYAHFSVTFSYKL